LMPFDYTEIGGSIGVLDIKILNPLRCPSTCANIVDINLFVSASDDFQFAGPSGGLPPASRATGSSVVFYPETGEIDGPIADTISGRENAFESGRCFGEHISSVRQMLLRTTGVPLAGAITGLTAADAVQYWPWHIANAHLDTGGTIYRSNCGMDIYSFIAPMYAVYRGSMRVKPGVGTTFLASGPYAATSHCGVDVKANVPIMTVVNSSLAINAAWSSNTSMNGIGIGLGDINICSVYKVPYYNKYKFSVLEIPLTGDKEVINKEPSAPYTVVQLCSGSTTFVTQRAIDDDFQFSYFMGCPPLFISYV